MNGPGGLGGNPFGDKGAATGTDTSYFSFQSDPTDADTARGHGGQAV